MLKIFIAYCLFLWMICGSVGCSTPETTMNFFTPDRFGYGIMHGTSTWKGSGDMTTIWNSDVGDIYWDVKGEQESSIMYLEWDLPQWENSNYDKYLRDRVRQLSIELEMAREQDDQESQS